MIRIAILAGILLSALLTPASAEQMKWQTFAYKEDGNNGRYTATLTLGVPETDNQVFQAICKPGGNPNYIPTTIGYNTGNLRRGAATSLRFFATGKAGRKTYRLRGKVFKPASEEGLYGIRLQPKTNDELWQLLSKYRTVSVKMNGRAAQTMSLKGSSVAIRKFLIECRGIIGDS